MSKPTGKLAFAYQSIAALEQKLADARAELAALKAEQGEAVAWRGHSVNYAKGEKCPATIETLQAAWDRDQELLLDQKSEISKLKETINQLRQKRSAPPATAYAVSVPRELLDEDGLDAIQEWAEGEDQTVNVGPVQGDFDEHIESTAGYAVRLMKELRAILAQAKP